MNNQNSACFPVSIVKLNIIRSKEILLMIAQMISLALLMMISNINAAVNIYTDRYDNARTSANIAETILNAANVNGVNFGKLWSYPVDGYMQAQPLYVAGLSINGAIHNVIFVATMNDKVYAYDADAPGSALWVRDFTSPPAITALPLSDIEPPTGGDIPVIGVRSTPVIDPTTNTMYLVAHTKETSGSTVSYAQRLHAIDITTGAERSGSPINISATAPGTTPDAISGVITFNPKMQNQRAGLALANGQVVIAWASHDDILPYHGWVMTYNASTLAQTGVWLVTPDYYYGGIWQGGRAPAVDASGNVYYSTGNATWDGVRNWGDSVIKLRVGNTGISLLDWFTPSDQATLNSQDLDLGSSGPALIPNSNSLIAGGKESILYVMNSNNLGHYNSSDGQILQRIDVNKLHFMHGFGVYWNSATLGPMVYNWTEEDAVTGWHFNGTIFDTPVLIRGNTVAPGHPGGALVLSANGNTSGTGILWGQLPDVLPELGLRTTTSTLYAYDAETLAEIWNSGLNPLRDKVGTYMKFATPISANGKIYMANADNQVVVFGLLSTTPDFSMAVTPSVGAVTPGSSVTYSVIIGAVNGYTSPVNLSVTGLPAGASSTFSPSAIAGAGISNMQITLPANALPGNYSLKITGTGGSLLHTASIGLNVISPLTPSVDAKSFSDSSAPSTTVTSSGINTNFTNELLLAFVSTDYVSGPNTTVTSISGAGLTWTLVRRTNVQSGTSEIWRAYSPAKLTNVSVTATLSQSVSASITILSVSNIDTSRSNGSGAIGAVGTANSLAGAPNGSLVTTRANSLVFGVGNDFDNAIARTVNSSQTMIHQFLSPVGDTYWVQQISSPVPNAGSTATINDSAPTTDRYNLSLVEILGPLGANTTYSISGTLGLSTLTAGSTVSLSGTSIATVTVDASGSFTFANLANGSYTVTPHKSGVTFSPASQSVTINGSNVTEVSFSATASSSSSISGSLTPLSLTSGSTVTLSGAATMTVTADASGNYIFGNLANGSYVVTPNKSGVTFSPASQSVTINGNNAAGVTFTGTSSSAGITIDATASKDSTIGSNTVTSPAFSTSAGNEMVLALIATDYLSGANTTVMAVSGGGLTWTLIVRANAQSGTSEIWRAFAPAALSNQTITATLSQGVHASLSVMSFKGVDTTGTNAANAIGATSTASSRTGAPTASLTTTRSGSLIVGVGNDFENAISRTLGSGQTLIHQYLAPIGDTYWMQRTSVPTSAAGTKVTINDTNPTTDRYNLAIAEIRTP